MKLGNSKAYRPRDIQEVKPAPFSRAVLILLKFFNNTFRNFIMTNETCSYCGEKVVTIQDEWTDAVVCLSCESGDEWEGYEDDGQPDEAQEWYDFDPDC
jgi:hypothetical protein